MSLEGSAEENNVVKGRIVNIPLVDDTLTKTGYSADAKVTGDKFTEMSNRIDGIDPHDASNVAYDNTNSGLESTNVQSAVDEISENAYQKTGGMVEGVVHFRNADNGYASLHKNNTDTTDYGTKIVDRTKDNKNAFLTVRASNNELSFTNNEGNTSNIFTEGNKPFGEYVGNGSDTSRVIETKGIGRLLLVYSDTRLAFVTPKGAFVINLSDGSNEWIDGAKVSYLNGNLTLATTSVAFNNSDITYYYQAI